MIRQLVLSCACALGLSTGFWAQCDLQQLLATDLAAGDRLGSALAIDGALAIAGAPYDDDGGSDAGSAQIFRHDGTQWSPEQKLVARDANADDHFGAAVAIGGTLALVGAPEDDEIPSDAGSVHVFRYDGSQWVLEQKLANPDPGSSENFGSSVATNGVVIAVGCKRDGALLSGAGAVWAWNFPGEGCLVGGPDSIFLAPGGSHQLYLAAGLAHADDVYMVLGTFSGTSPGLVFDGQLLPLSFDLYTLTLITTPTLISGGLRILGTAGQAKASLVVPAGAGPSLVGVTAHHAFVVIDPTLIQVTLTSNAVPITFVP